MRSNYFWIQLGQNYDFIPDRLRHFANQDLNLAHLAQDIGYPDSTHFSHSIRRFYGLKPRAIFVGSRDLAIYRSTETVRLAEAS